MRVLLVPLGSRGDVQPMLALGRALLKAGHQARMCTSRDFRESVEAAGIPFEPIELDARKIVEQAGEALFNPVSFIRVARAHAAPTVAAMDRACRDVDLAVGAGLQPVARSFCEKRGIRYAYVSYSPNGIPSAYLPPFMLRRQSLPRWANRLAWWIQGRAFTIALGKPINEVRHGLDLPPLRNLLTHTMMPPRVLGAFDRALVDVPPDWPASVEIGGAWHLDDATPLPAALEEFLAAGPKPVFVGFGSMPSKNPAALTRAIVEAASAAGVRVVIGSGWAGLGASALPPSCLAVGAVSHGLLFPRCEAVVHHGGAGTTAAATRAGVPQLVVPHLMDQFYWGARTFACGLGPAPIAIAKLSANRLAPALRALADGRFSARAAQIGAEVRAVDGLANAVASLERFLMV